MKFYMYGDILHAAEICVEAKNEREALSKAKNGLFEIVNQDNKELGFMWNGDKVFRKPHGMD